MSAHESYSTLVNSRAPSLAPGATTQSFKTYSSAAYEPDAISPPLTVPKRSANLALGERPSIHGDIFDPSIKAIAGTLICVGLAVILALASFFIWP